MTLGGWRGYGNCCCCCCGGGGGDGGGSSCSCATHVGGVGSRKEEPLLLRVPHLREAAHLVWLVLVTFIAPRRCSLEHRLGGIRLHATAMATATAPHVVVAAAAATATTIIITVTVAIAGTIAGIIPIVNVPVFSFHSLS